MPKLFCPSHLDVHLVAGTIVGVLAVACVTDTGPDAIRTTTGAVQTVCGGVETVLGIDVSQYQSTIDWDALAASDDAEFAYIRVGNGLGTDTRFATNWPEARRVGIRRGAYQYFRPGTDALEQAEHYLAVIDAAGGYLPDDLPPMIDVETTDGQNAATIVEAVATWMDHVEAETGMRPVIYTGSYFWDDNVGSDAFASDHLWTAHYTAAACPLISSSWARWTLWQYTSTGRVAGIVGDVDRNRFNGTVDELDRWPDCSRYNPISTCPEGCAGADCDAEPVAEAPPDAGPDLGGDVDAGGEPEVGPDLSDASDAGGDADADDLEPTDVSGDPGNTSPDAPGGSSGSMPRFARTDEGIDGGCQTARVGRVGGGGGGLGWLGALACAAWCRRQGGRLRRRR